MKPSFAKKVMAVLLGIGMAALIMMHILQGELLILGLNK